jgi:hypothetical protein
LIDYNGFKINDYTVLDNKLYCVDCVKPKNDLIVIECPHCKELAIISELNCKIFRHGMYKNNFQQIDPHLNKSECNGLVNESNFVYFTIMPCVQVIQFKHQQIIMTSHL